MSAFWDYYWPAVTAALVIGALAGAFGFRSPVRRGRRNIALLVGIAASIAVAALWHGPLGASGRFASEVEGRTRQLLVDFEMGQVQARFERDPWRRTLRLTGPADDFQRGELVRILEAVPGVARAYWQGTPRPSTLPLWIEAAIAALVGFGLGLLLSYLLELRRRSRAEWRW
jgi:hypothetical protein